MRAAVDEGHSDDRTEATRQTSRPKPLSESLRERLDWYHAGLVAIALACGAMAMVHLARAPFWRDEAWTASISGRSLGGGIRVMFHREINMGLYYMLAHFWLWFGSSEAWLRSLSVIFAVLAVIVFGAAVGRFLGRRAGLAAAVLLGVNPFLLTHARDARAYTLVVLLAACASYCFVRTWPDGTNRWSIAYVVCVVALAYAHLLAPLIIGAHLAVLLVAKVWSRRWAILYGIAAVGIAPLYLYALFNDKGQSDWIDKPNLHAVRDLARTLLGSTSAILACGLLIVVGIVLALWSRRLNDRLAVVAGLMALVAPIAVVWIVSQAKPLFVDRYLLFVVLGLVLLLVLAAVKFPGGVLATVIITAGLAAHFLQMDRPVLNSRMTIENIRAGVQEIHDEGRSDDALLFAPSWSRVGFEYYAHRIPVSPQDAALAPHGLPTDLGDVLTKEISATALDERLKGVSRIWVVGYGGDGWRIAPEPALALVAEHTGRGDWVKLDEKTYGEFIVDLYQVKTG